MNEDGIDSIHDRMKKRNFVILRRFQIGAFGHRSRLHRLHELDDLVPINYSKN